MRANAEINQVIWIYPARNAPTIPLACTVAQLKKLMQNTGKQKHPMRKCDGIVTLYEYSRIWELLDMELL